MDRTALSAPDTWVAPEPAQPAARKSAAIPAKSSSNLFIRFPPLSKASVSSIPKLIISSYKLAYYAAKIHPLFTVYAKFRIKTSEEASRTGNFFGCFFSAEISTDRRLLFLAVSLSLSARLRCFHSKKTEIKQKTHANLIAWLPSLAIAGHHGGIAVNQIIQIADHELFSHIRYHFLSSFMFTIILQFPQDCNCDL